MSIQGRPSNNYNDELYGFLKVSEGFRSKVYTCLKGVPTVGVGYALLVETGKGLWKERDNLASELGTVGVRITQNDQDILQKVVGALNNKDVVGAQSITKSSRFSFIVDDTQARQLFDTIIPNYENAVRARIGENLYQRLQGSEEMIALVSLAYNTPALIGPGLLKALQDENRAEAYYQIEYVSNKNQSPGLASRRNREADMFSPFNDPDNPTSEEVQQLLTTYETHKGKILAYERFYGKNIDLMDDIIADAKDALVCRNEPIPPPNPHYYDNACWLEPVLWCTQGDEPGAGAQPKVIKAPKPIVKAKKRVVDASQAGNAFIGSPLILDIDNDGVETIPLGNGVFFDHDGNGLAEQSGWVGKDDGLLVLDRDGDGRITSGQELFGNSTILRNGWLASNGFAALADLDENGDGLIDSRDSICSSLQVWRDFDQDGTSTFNELKSLNEVGITSINTVYLDSYLVDSSGNYHLQKGDYLSNAGNRCALTDVWFPLDRVNTVSADPVIVPDDIAALPDLKGFGNLCDLHQAMALDATGRLKGLVEQIISEVNPDTRTAMLDMLLYTWAGSELVDPASRGVDPYSGEITIDARKMGVLEKIMAEGYVGKAGTLVNYAAGVPLNHAYHTIREMYYGQLMAQSGLRPLYELISYTWDETANALRGDLSPVAAVLMQNLQADEASAKLQLENFVRTLKGMDATEIMNYDSFCAQVTSGRTDLVRLIDGAGLEKVLGTPAADTLYIRNGANIVDAGEGDDSIQGYGGYATFLYGKDSGNDLIDNWDDFSLDDGYYRVQIKEGLIKDSFEYTRNPDSLIMKIKETGETLTLHDWFKAGNRTREAKIEFADGTEADLLDLMAATPIRGTNGNDTLCGYDYGDCRDTLCGGPGDDFLDGGSGPDSMRGGPGNDTYVANYSREAIVEGLDEGEDTVRSTVSYTLGANLENLTLLGNSAISGTGNRLDNEITGNSRKNVLKGGPGDDLLKGGAGNDTLVGGAGNDTYLFSAGDGRDVVADTVPDASASDRIAFDDSVLEETVAFFQSGQNLVISYGNNDRITVANQKDPNCGIERLELSNGSFLTDSDINQVIQQMAAFASAHGISFSRVEDVRKSQDLEGIIVNSWHT